MFADLDDLAIDQYVIRVNFLEGWNAGASVEVPTHDIRVPLTALEEAQLREWLDEVVLAHPECF